jgi:hypothetical protein
LHGRRRQPRLGFGGRSRQSLQRVVPLLLQQLDLPGERRLLLSKLPDLAAQARGLAGFVDSCADSGNNGCRD